MMNRIAVPFLAVSLLASAALAAEPSPKSPVASPAKVAMSPKPVATPAKAAAVKKPCRVARKHAHVMHHAAATTTDATTPPVAASVSADKTAKSTVTK